MGIVRFALALVVILSHCGFQKFNIGAQAAVQAFFVLSGMYMTAVYNVKYSKMAKGVKMFYANRFLRLYPTYLVLMLVAFVVYFLNANTYPDVLGVFTLFRCLHDPMQYTQIIASITALSLFGQDIISLSAGLHNLLPLRQSWSIGTELLFYLLVPLLFGRARLKHYLLGFALFIFIKEMTFLSYGERVAYFLPIGNLCYFLLGCSLYLISTSPFVQKIISGYKAKLIRHLALAAMLALLFFFQESSFEICSLFHHLSFLALFSICAILLFQKSENKLDRVLGNLAYGVYLNHFLIFEMLVWHHIDGIKLPALLIFFSLCVAFILEKLIQQPIDRFRHNLYSKHPSPSVLGQAAEA